MKTDPVILLLSIGTVVLLASLPLGIATLLRFDGKAVRFFKEALAPIAIAVAFTLMVAAVVSSLYMSEIKNFKPCLLCWIQRSLVYPQIVLLGGYLFYKSRALLKISLVIAVVTILIASYNYYIEWFPGNEAGFCSAKGGQSCTQIWFRQFGFVTIPFMSIVLGLWTAIIVLIGLKNSNHKL